MPKSVRVLAAGLLILGLGALVRADVIAVQVTVTTAATALATATQRDGRKSVEVSHACASSIFVGGSAVTTGTGRALASGSTLSIVLVGGETLYGIYASGTCSVTVLKSGGVS